MNRLTGELPPWPDDAPVRPSTMRRAACDDALTELETRIGALTADSGLELHGVVRELAEPHAIRNQAIEADARERVAVLARVHSAVAQLRGLPSAEAMIAAAPRQACEACDFDRAVLYRVRGRELIAESLWVKDDPDAAARMLAFSREHPAVLEPRVLEAEMVRRRRVLRGRTLAGDRQVLAELAKAYDTRSYVAAPIMPEGRVIGFIHADHRLKPRQVDDFDRDCLWAFAEGFGLAVERAQLIDRLRAQGRELQRLLQRTEAVVAEYLTAEVELASGDYDDGPTSRATSAIIPITDNTVSRELTRRELEVLELLGAGASNASIATRLSTHTAKSHVKRILRKLGAANRVEAATMWVQAQSRWSPDLGHALRTG